MKYDFLGLGVVVFGVVILIGVAVIADIYYRWDISHKSID